ncbi:hypothetical protein GCM10010168_31780 [Actinoplanes ianthinogenes]|uniref:Uncharacterized protein n=1 Tax=Actinoplanes ianthinogenes TaxID=122358 RepID=A0ABN6C4H0_9ACTN|nr:hypothetical protein Aiant_09760 [Actinoplanes ianthinogenes]GGR11502.1 hypothetical protein GCM10010168_31780 [Actinoplanes ianthinogenes]
MAQYRLDSGTSASTMIVVAGSTLAIGAISTRPLPNRRLDAVRPLPRRLPPVRVESALLRVELCVPVLVVADRGCGTFAFVSGASPQVSQ